MEYCLLPTSLFTTKYLCNRYRVKEDKKGYVSKKESGTWGTGWIQCRGQLYAKLVCNEEPKNLHLKLISTAYPISNATTWIYL